MRNNNNNNTSASSSQSSVSPESQQAGPSNSGKAKAHGEPKRSTADGTLSCAECRRLKFKCNRVWPCGSCVKRGLEDLCPDGVQETNAKPRKPRQSSNASSWAVMERLEALERSVQSVVGIAQSGQLSALSAAHAGPSHMSSNYSYAAPAHFVPAPTASATPGPSSLDGLNSLAEAAMGEPLSRRYQPVPPPPPPQQQVSSSSAGTASEERGNGTLAVGQDGRTFYLGPNAHSFYLARDAERAREMVASTRPGSPVPDEEQTQVTRGWVSSVPIAPDMLGNAPASLFDSPGGATDDALGPPLAWTTPGIRSPHSSATVVNLLRPRLPAYAEACRLVQVYFASCVFMWEPITRAEFEETIFAPFYGSDVASSGAAGGQSSSGGASSGSNGAALHPHKLAVLFAALSLGSLFDTARSPAESQSQQLYSCAWASLALSNFTEAPSLEALIALHLIGLYLTSRRGGRYAESFFPILGMATRMAVAMGLHRDPGTWNLGLELREKRRRIFHELQCFDVFRSLAFCRPPGLLDRHTDVEIPQSWIKGEQEGDTSAAFHAAKCRLIQLDNRMLDECLCSNVATYAATLQFDHQLRRMLQATPVCLHPNIAHHAASTLPASPADMAASAAARDAEACYADQDKAMAMRYEFQRHTHTLNIHQSLLLIHRSWFAKALHDTKCDPLGGAYAKSVIAVHESAGRVIDLTRSIYTHYPLLVLRWYYLFNALFSAAAVQGLHVVRAPQSMLALASFEKLQQAVSLLEGAAPHNPPLSPPLVILRRLLGRAKAALERGCAAEAGDTTGANSDEDPAELDLVGEETRLLSHSRRAKRQRVGKNETRLATPTNRGERSDSALRNGALSSFSPRAMNAGQMDVALDPLLWGGFEGVYGGPAGPAGGVEQHGHAMPGMENEQAMLQCQDVGEADHLLHLLSSGIAWDDLSGWDGLLGQL